MPLNKETEANQIILKYIVSPFNKMNSAVQFYYESMKLSNLLESELGPLKISCRLIDPLIDL